MKSYGLVTLGIFLVAFGIAGLGVPLGIVVPILALVSGILILLGK